MWSFEHFLAVCCVFPILLLSVQARKKEAWEGGIQACKSATEKSSFNKLWLANCSGVLVECSKDEFLERTAA